MHAQPSDERSGSIARNLGRFFGNIKRGFTQPLDAPQTREVRRETTEESVDSDAGPVTLRRTTIEEVELPSPKLKPEERDNGG